MLDPPCVLREERKEGKNAQRQTGFTAKPGLFVRCSGLSHPLRAKPSTRSNEQDEGTPHCHCAEASRVQSSAAAYRGRTLLIRLRIKKISNQNPIFRKEYLKNK